MASTMQYRSLRDFLKALEARGMPLTAFFMPAARASVSDLLEVVFQTPAIGTLNLASADGPDRTR